MKLKPTLRKATELGISLSAVATLILAGCGGGGSSNNTNPGTVGATSSVKVTPGKGIMYGATVTIANNNGATVLNSSTTGLLGATNAGTATISISSAAVGPFVVSVTCPATCQYFDEKSGKLVNGTANAPAMLAVISSTAMLDIGVTAATNAAAKFALAAGTLTPTSVAVANATVAATFGLGTSPTAILTPPTIISDSTTLAAALAGTSTADKLASYSAALAEAASGVSALQAIDDYGTAWQNAAITPASGVILPPDLDPAVITTVASAIPVTTTVVSTTTASTAIASAVADAGSLLSDGMAGNTGGWWQNQYYANAAAAASGVLTTDVFAWKDTVTSPATNTYNFGGSDLRLVNGAYVTNTDPDVDYVLDSTGWVINGNGGTVVNNLDGTLTVTPTGRSPVAVTITSVDLSGTTVPCYTASCTTATYPTGSVYYYSTDVTPAPSYRLRNGTTQFPSKVTNLNGVALTALPAAGGSMCVQMGSTPGAQVFTPITPTASGDNYNVYGSWSCSAADITGALTGTPQGTIMLSVENTGNTAVPQVGLATITTSAGLATFPWLNNAIIAVRAGQVYPGYKRNFQVDLSTFTKAAANAELKANGYPALP